MSKAHSFKRQLRRLGASCMLALSMLAGGFSLDGAKAEDLPAWGQGVVIVPAAYEGPAAPAQVVAEPSFKRGKIVPLAVNHPAGTVIVSTKKKMLYLVLGDGMAVRYRVATAKPGFEWKGTHKVSAKVKWPDWRPPVEMRERRPDLPEFMEGGPDNPLGARALYLGSSIYRIHGTNEPKSIGKAASSGCIRMLNGDVEELYRHVKIGATVIVL